MTAVSLKAGGGGGVAFMKACQFRPITCASEFCRVGAGAGLGLCCGFLLKSGHKRWTGQRTCQERAPGIPASSSGSQSTELCLMHQSSGWISGVGRRMVEGARGWRCHTCPVAIACPVAAACQQQRGLPDRNWFGHRVSAPRGRAQPLLTAVRRSTGQGPVTPWH